MNLKLAAAALAAAALLTSACSSNGSDKDDAGSASAPTEIVRDFPLGWYVVDDGMPFVVDSTQTFKVSQAIRRGLEVVVIQEHPGLADPAAQHAALACSNSDFGAAEALCLN